MKILRNMILIMYYKLQHFFILKSMHRWKRRAYNECKLAARLDCKDRLKHYNLSVEYDGYAEEYSLKGNHCREKLRILGCKI